MKIHEDTRIGTLAGKGQDTPNYLRQILPHGFKNFEMSAATAGAEVTGQVRALHCLQDCRGSAFIANPV